VDIKIGSEKNGNPLINNEDYMISENCKYLEEKSRPREETCGRQT
jgi:hypothetical protein